MPRAVVKCLPFPSLGTPGHELTRKASSVRQLFPKTGGGGLTRGTAPPQGFWRDAVGRPCALSLLTLLPSGLEQTGGGPSPQRPLAKALPRGLPREKSNPGGEPGRQLCAQGARCEPGTLPMVAPEPSATLVAPESRRSSSQGAFPIPPR